MKHIIVGCGIAGSTLYDNLRKNDPYSDILILDNNFTSSASFHSNAIVFRKFRMHKKSNLLKHFLGLRGVGFSFKRTSVKKRNSHVRVRKKS